LSQQLKSGTKQMMSLIVVPILAFIVALLTFFSGFGLGTLLTPALAAFISLQAAISLTAVVHLLNGILKLALTFRSVNFQLARRFGTPAILAAIGGAWILSRLSNANPIYSYAFWGREFEVLPLKLTIAILIVLFTLLEAVPRLQKLSFDRRYMVIGGLLSGFFGGLSGHQGALRSAFLARAGLDQQGFIATGAMISCLVDMGRLFVYAETFSAQGLSENTALLTVTTLAAFAGSYLGNRMLKKITMRSLQMFVSISLCVFAVALGAGWI